MLQITSLVSLVSRLKAALELVQLAEDVIPRLVADGVTTAENAATILGQVPALRADIEQQVQNVKNALESIQDRVEALAQFLLLHRKALTAEQASELNRHLAAIRD